MHSRVNCSENFVRWAERYPYNNWTAHELFVSDAMSGAVTALACSRTAYIGVTGDQLLANKKVRGRLSGSQHTGSAGSGCGMSALLTASPAPQNAHLIWPFERREAAAAEYIKAVRPSLDVQTSALLDPKVC